MFSVLPQLSEGLRRSEFCFLFTLAVPFLWTLGRDSWLKLFLVLLFYFHTVVNIHHIMKWVLVNAAAVLIVILKYFHAVCQHCPGRPLFPRHLNCFASCQSFFSIFFCKQIKTQHKTPHKPPLLRHQSLPFTDGWNALPGLPCYFKC